ncbi:hypothetical protein GCM10009000_043680 [Halobacterium noricense]|uniref:GIY-YIG domain-containing protein n=1 Tax=Haladaptatus pallidirubidus TaxID=1008152 RepID=A0AAV3UF36_9EURY
MTTATRTFPNGLRASSLTNTATSVLVLPARRTLESPKWRDNVRKEHSPLWRKAESTGTNRTTRSLSGVTTHWVYVIECNDGSFYTGYTTDVERRVAEHDTGEGAKYTRGRTPVELIHTERFDSKSAAMSREYEIKQLSRAQKEKVVDY